MKTYTLNQKRGEYVERMVKFTLLLFAIPFFSIITVMLVIFSTSGDPDTVLIIATLFLIFGLLLTFFIRAFSKNLYTQLSKHARYVLDENTLSLTFERPENPGKNFMLFVSPYATEIKMELEKITSLKFRFNNLIVLAKSQRPIYIPKELDKFNDLVAELEKATGKKMS